MIKFSLWQIGVLTLAINCIYTEPAEYRWGLTSLFQSDREDEMNPAIYEVGIDYKISIATLHMDTEDLFPGVRTEKNLIDQFSQLLRTHTRGVVEALPRTETPPEKTKEVTIPITGLVCKDCSYEAYLAVNKIPEVDYATASFQKGELYARIDTHKETTGQPLREALLNRQITLNYKLYHPSLVPRS